VQLAIAAFFTDHATKTPPQTVIPITNPNAIRHPKWTDPLGDWDRLYAGLANNRQYDTGYQTIVVLGECVPAGAMYPAGNYKGWKQNDVTNLITELHGINCLVFGYVFSRNNPDASQLKWVANRELFQGVDANGPVPDPDTCSKTERILSITGSNSGRSSTASILTRPCCGICLIRTIKGTLTRLTICSMLTNRLIVTRKSPCLLGKRSRKKLLYRKLIW
jgi:hypothetical protein